ncbi:hypothetical protein GCM10016455_02240 [Aliiroseovarius zhejiangensis]|uniref:Uncharacterized protein n=1 Tax=Aliiroseovarius zhejiangensis TaxID=1632025 RepID=A0ABQ3IK84_9RHOB|nr:hypothetical protein [Aliiroseovarius zhejiangensis]GHE86263.1 hypothetical protein GCM10016455_02240 [Aliiroseovarius zhejiangensis]
MSTFETVTARWAWAGALALALYVFAGIATAQDRTTEPFLRTYAAARAAPTIAEEGGWRTIRVEYWSKAIFSFTYNVDKEICQFLIWLSDAEDDFPNKIIDFGCDGTPDRIRTLADREFQNRPLTDFETRVYAYFLPRAAASFEAASLIKSYNPEPKLALVPDAKIMRENRELMQEIANAATNSTLMGNPEHSETLKPNDRVFRIFVNNGAKNGGATLTFFAEKASGRSLRSCSIDYEDPTNDVVFLDRACDSVFEYASDNGKGRKLAVAGMEGVIKGVLLDVARFARVANTYFSLN